MAYRRKKKGLMALFSKKPKRGRPRLSDHDVRGGFNVDWGISQETKNGIIIIFLFVLAALSLLGLFDLSGGFGRGIVMILSWLLGVLKWLFPVMALLFGYFMLRVDKYQVKFVNYFGALLLILGITSLWHLQFGVDGGVEAAKSGLGGGYIGVILSLPLLKFTGIWGSIIVSLAVFLVGVLLTFETSLYGLMWPIKLIKFIYAKLSEMTKRDEVEPEDDDYEEDDQDEDYEEEDEEEEIEEDEEEEDAPQFGKKAVEALPVVDKAVAAEEPDIAQPKKFGKKIELPLDLLTGKSGKPTSGDIKNNQKIIKQTLANFGIQVDMSEVNIGPTVTQYAFRPADGVKLSKITNLNSDLALALAAHPIRIEAPIPGRSLVGIEIPNQQAAKVTMKSMLSSDKFKQRPSNMVAALGKDVSGNPTFTSIDKMPHLLIAGSTGSGKSVCVNAIITSLLYQNSPDELKFILVDPKRVELPLYNGIPYLLTPVITDVKKTVNALKWTVTEMERRFEVLSKAGDRNIASYNKTHVDKLPYIVFVIDELADLMSTAASEVEGGIVRLAQMARAVGIHLILATQRPSVEVITGLIKANIPGRIAFSVASLIDSRTILDSSGAEQLVGNGDMLYLGPEISKPKRVQGVFISDKETKNIIDYIKAQGEADYVEGVVEKPSGGGYVGSMGSDDEGDALLPDAKDVIRESGKASASLLQRRLKVGYARAARILDILEDQGIIGPADGAKPREVFLDRLGGTDSLSFAAKEHDLTGELRDLEEENSDEEDEELEEDFQQDEEEMDEEDVDLDVDENDDDMEDEEDEDEDDDEDYDSEEAEEDYEEDEEEEGSRTKKSFSQDEWT